MARPLTVDFVSNVTGFIKGTNDIERALDDVSDSLDDVARDAGIAGDRAGSEFADGYERSVDGIERYARDAGEEAGKAYARGLEAGRPAEELEREFNEAAAEVEARIQRMQAELDGATDRMEADFRGTFNEVPVNAKTNLDRASDAFDDGASRAKASMQEVKQEALQNASETFSSFDGSARSLVDGVQGTFGGLVSSLGPLGAAIGAAGGLAIGAITSNFEKASEKAQEFRDNVADALAALREGGGRFEADEITERLEQLAEAAEDGTVALKQMNEAAKEGGVDLGEYARAIASMDASQLTEVRDEFSRVIEEQNRARESEEEFSISSALARGEMIDLMQTEIDRIDETIKTRREAEELKRLMDEAGIESAEARADREEAAQERIRSAAEVTATSFQESADRVRETNEGMADAVVSAFDEVSGALTEAADDGKLSIGELEDAMREAAERQQASAERWAWAAQNLSQNQIDALLDMGEAGELALETIMNSPPEATAETLGYLEDQGRAKGEAERRGVASGVEGDGPIRIPTRVDLDQSAYEAFRSKLANTSIPVRVRWDIQQAV